MNNPTDQPASVAFWQFIEILKRLDRDGMSEDWLLDATDILHRYEPAVQHRFKLEFSNRVRSLENRIDACYPSTERDRLFQLYLPAFVVTQGKEFYDLMHGQPERLASYNSDYGNRSLLFNAAQSAGVQVLEPEASPLQVPLDLLAPSFALSLVRAFKEGESIESLAENYQQDPLVIEALLRLVWTIAERVS